MLSAPLRAARASHRPRVRRFADVHRHHDSGGAPRGARILVLRRARRARERAHVSAHASDRDRGGAGGKTGGEPDTGADGGALGGPLLCASRLRIRRLVTADRGLAVLAGCIVEEADDVALRQTPATNASRVRSASVRVSNTPAMMCAMVSPQWSAGCGLGVRGLILVDGTDANRQQANRVPAGGAGGPCDSGEADDGRGGGEAITPWRGKSYERARSDRREALRRRHGNCSGPASSVRGRPRWPSARPAATTTTSRSR